MVWVTRDSWEVGSGTWTLVRKNGDGVGVNGHVEKP